MVLIFKTDAFSQLEYHVKALLSSFKNISKIDFDFEDCDKILRIEATENLTAEIEFLLNSKGFFLQRIRRVNYKIIAPILKLKF